VCDVLNNEIQICPEKGLDEIYRLAMVTWGKHFLNQAWTMENTTPAPLDQQVTDVVLKLIERERNREKFIILSWFISTLIN
jgi:hypothetical protein